MDKYRRVRKPREKQAEAKENEIRVMATRGNTNYIAYALKILQQAENPASEIKIKAMGNAINNAVTIAEIVKRRVAGLYQNVEIDAIEITDVFEPLEEGLKTVESKRRVPNITITLSKNQLDQSAAGYQPPIPADQVQPEQTENKEAGGYRGRGRGGFRGRGRGRGGFRGRGRGRGRGGNNTGATGTSDAQDTTVETNVEAPIVGGDENHSRGGYRGRGRGGYRGRGRGGYRGRGRGGFRDNMNGGGDFNESSGNDEFANETSGNNEDGGFRGRGRGGYRGRGRGGFRGRGRGRGGFRGRGRGRGGGSDAPQQQ